MISVCEALQAISNVGTSAWCQLLTAYAEPDPTDAMILLKRLSRLTRKRSTPATYSDQDVFLDGEGTRVERYTHYLDIRHVRSPRATKGEAQQLRDNTGDIDGGEAEEVKLVKTWNDNSPG